MGLTVEFFLGQPLDTPKALAMPFSLLARVISMIPDTVPTSGLESVKETACAVTWGISQAKVTFEKSMEKSHLESKQPKFPGSQNLEHPLSEHVTLGGT